jgi:hypothetical protein
VTVFQEFMPDHQFLANRNKKKYQRSSWQVKCLLLPGKQHHSQSETRIQPTKLAVGPELTVSDVLQGRPDVASTYFAEIA